MPEQILKKQSFIGVLHNRSPKTIRASLENVARHLSVEKDSTRLPGALRDLHKTFELSLPHVVIVLEAIVSIWSTNQC